MKSLALLALALALGTGVPAIAKTLPASRPASSKHAAKPASTKPASPSAARPAPSATAMPDRARPRQATPTLFAPFDSVDFLPDTAILARVGDRTIRVMDFRDRYFASDAQLRPGQDSSGRAAFL